MNLAGGSDGKWHCSISLVQCVYLARHRGVRPDQGPGPRSVRASSVSSSSGQRLIGWRNRWHLIFADDLGRISSRIRHDGSACGRVHRFLILRPSRGGVVCILAEVLQVLQAFLGKWFVMYRLVIQGGDLPGSQTRELKQV